MAVAQADIDAMRAAAAAGVLEVRFSDGRSVKYASPSEILAVAAQLQGVATGGTFDRTTYTSFARD